MKIHTFKLSHLLFGFGGAAALGLCIVCASMLAPAATAMRLLPIYSVETDEKTIALTFDSAWGDEDTDAILRVLDTHGIKATFFVTGDYAERCAQSVRKFHEAGHEIANHSDLHPHVNAMTAAALAADTERCSEKIAAITGTKPSLYRAPYGEYNNKIIETVTKLGYSFIQWDCDSIDYKNPDTQTMQARILKHVRNGSILLFHTGTENTAAALGEILPSLKAQGYTFKPVGQLIYKEDFTIDHTGRQIKR